MESERTKVASLEAFRANLQTELSSTKTLELESRRNLLAASDENEALKKRHAREIADMELSLSRKDRECRELKDEIEGLRREVKSERDTVSALKVFSIFSSVEMSPPNNLCCRAPSLRSRPHIFT